MDKEIQANQWWIDTWHERTSPLDPSSPNWFWKKEEEREKGRGVFVERECLTSFYISRRAKRQSCFPRQELWWIPVLWSFDKLRKVGVFSYLIISLFKSLVDGWSVLGQNGREFLILRSGTEGWNF